MTITAATETPRFTGKHGDRNYRQWLNDDAVYRVGQARAAANARQTVFEDALERSGELFVAGRWAEARAVLALAMEG